MKRSKILAAILSLVMILTTLPLTAVNSFAEGETCGDFRYYIISEEEKTCEIASYYGSETKLEIPSMLDEYTVIGINYKAFKSCTSLDNITIPDSVTRIEAEAFNDTAYYNNKDNWEDGVLYIGNFLVATDTVYDYDSETYITTVPSNYKIKDGTTVIADTAFIKCTLLKNIEIPDSVTNMGCRTFESCTSLESVKISENITSIEDDAFLECSSLKSITIPDGVTSIEYRAFGDCAALKSVIIPDTVTNISYNAFIGCKSLETVKLSKNITSIEYSTFCGCSSLKNIDIPESVETISQWAFSYCPSLENVTLHEGLKTIGPEAFIGCPSLKSITIPKSVTEIFEKSFGFVENRETYESEKIDDFIVYGYAGTEAERYAKDSGFKFVDLENMPDEPTPTPEVPADLNGDGKTTVVDAKWVLQSVANTRNLTDEQRAAADVNGDGKLSVVDAKWILQAVAGMRDLAKK